ncbi:metallophosphoesterase [Polycladomyces subterraneus]|uniref:Metallophosphoesterase n=1 Tax=Polycladomyces subterraneus TaxID=1016997 RepID=A0ABT8ILV3_9BACL|nr:metallophosphoesterase [Polycladomyces subterraneus]MDN4593726.1 metallophosphoesterase [Polycladomyces subterraneus]
MQVTTKLTRRQFLKHLLTASLGLAGLIGSAGVYGYWIEPYWHEVEHVSIRIPCLPQAFEGMRIVQFSDLHLGFHLMPRDLDTIAKTIRRCQPDLLLFTGDLVDDGTEVVNEAIPYLTQLRAPLGQFAVLGNHDYRDPEAIVDGWNRSGFEVLRNEHRLIQKGEDVIVLAGIEDLLMSHPDIRHALDGLPANACTILMSHCPDVAEGAKHHPVDLQLSGHSHGGQIRLPLIGHVITPPGAKKYVDGWYQLDRMQLHVNRGIGTTLLPIRFNCRPQISVLELRREIS